MNFKTLVMCTLTAGFLAAGCSQKVNLMQVRASFDSHQQTIEAMEDKYKERQDLGRDLMAATSTPKSVPYPELKRLVSDMGIQITRAKEKQKKIEEFKPKFDASFQGKTSVSSENEAEWERYKGVMAEYNTLTSQLRENLNSFNSKNRSFTDLLQKHSIQRTSPQQLREEIESKASEVNQGMASMDETVKGNGKLISYSRQILMDPGTILKKMDTMDKMKDLLPPAKVEHSKLNAAKARALPALSGSQEIWMGPGMAGKTNEIAAVRKSHEVFMANKKTFDALVSQFETIVPPAAAQAVSGTATTP